MFAASILTMVGIFQIIAGLVAVIDDEFFVVTRNYTFDLDVTAWGWIHLLMGAGLLVTGLALFSGSGWAGITAMVLAMLSAMANFFFIPYYPIWSLVVIGLNIWVLWALSQEGVLRGAE